jgi:hypothetical protein
MQVVQIITFFEACFKKFFSLFFFNFDSLIQIKLLKKINSLSIKWLRLFIKLYKIKKKIITP